MDNPEKIQLFIFPLITLMLFIGGIAGLWLITKLLLPALGISA